MDNRLNKLINDNHENLEFWLDILNRQRESIFSDEDSETENRIDLTDQTANVLADLAELAIEYGNFKDEFDTSKMYLNLHGPSLIIRSLKTNQTFYLTIDLNGISLNTSIMNGDNLKNMDDSFWEELFAIKKLSGFDYEENSYFSIDVQRKYPELFRTYKNTMYLMFRKFFLSNTENHDNMDLGQLNVVWNTGEDFNTIIKEICLAFRSMYKMNYKLWKISDLKNKKTVTNNG